MSTDMAGRAVLRPAGNVARANLRKASKPPPSPVKSPLDPPSPKISAPTSLPSSPRTPARPAPLKQNSPTKLSPGRSPIPSPVSLHLPHQDSLPLAPLDLANYRSTLSLTPDVFLTVEDSDHNPEIYEEVVSGSLLDGDATSSRPEPAKNGPLVVSTASKSFFDGSLSSCKGRKPFLNRSTSLSGLATQAQNVATHGSASRIQKNPSPNLVLTKSTSEVFQRNSTTINLKPKASKKKDLNKLGSLSFDESSLATIVAAKKAAAKEISAQRKQKVSEYGRKQGKASRVAPDVAVLPPPLPLEPQRCKFVTAQSDLIYVEYHDKEWGVPVHDDRMLFELLSLAGFQVELSWTTILHKRDTYRAIFAEFDATEVALFNEKHIVTLEADKSLGLPLGKVRGVVTNAQRILKVVNEVGSLNEFLWGFVNKQPMVNRYRYSKQVPAKTSKAELISKDLVKRGFRFVGPTIIYSFMQASGMTNDHLVQCFRHQDCMKLSCSGKGSLKEELEGTTQHEDGASQSLPISFVLEEEEGLVCGEDCVSEWQEECMNLIEAEDWDRHEANTST